MNRTRTTFITAAMLMVLCSCGLQKKSDLIRPGEGTRIYAVSGDDFRIHISAFESAAKTQLGRSSYQVSVPINFGDTTDDSFDGVCVSYPDDTKEVFIKKSWWNTASHDARQALIFHELGHCELGRDHLNSTHTGTNSGVSVKVSIMNQKVPSPHYYNLYRNAYLKELFTLVTSDIIGQIDQ